MSTEQILALLTNMPLFDGASQPVLTKLAKSCSIIRYGKGVEILHKGQACEGFYCLIDGEIKLYFLTKDGHQKTIGIIGAGSSLGEADIFIRNSFPVFAHTRKKSKLVLVPRVSMVELMHNSPLVAMQMIALLSYRVQSMIHDLEMLCTLNAHERVVHYLLSNDQDLSDNSDVNIPSTKADVASSLHLAPETFSRVIHELEDESVINVNGKNIQVLDKKRLRSKSTF